MTKITDNNSVSTFNLSKWENIPWKKVNEQVRRIRGRIYSASEQKDYKRLRRLQKLAISSYAVTLYCVRKCTQISGGRKTPGIDKKVYLIPQDRLLLAQRIHKMNLKDWNPYRVRRRYIPKPDGSKRPLGIPAVIDRVLQAIIATALEPEWEAKFEPSSYGFRPGKSYQDAIHRVFTLLSKKDRVWIVEADIKGCFDNISHSFIMDRIKGFPASELIKKWLECGSVEIVDGQYNYLEAYEGTPQGGVISPLLSNIALHGLEEDLDIKYSSQGYVTKRDNPLHRTMIRYADDFIVVCPTRTIAEQTVDDLSKSLIKRGLTLNMSKTLITHTFNGFDFLGFNIRHRLKLGYKHVYIGDINNGIDPEYHRFVSTLVTASEKSLKNISHRLSDTFAKHRGKSAKQLINALNPIIRGYCNSKRTWSFSHGGAGRIETHLFKLQMRWCKRSHPKKSVDWCVKRYFTHYITKRINSKWTFKDPDTGIVCFKPIWYSTKRVWPPVVGSYSPDNPKLVEYWKDRDIKIFNSKVVDLNTRFDYSLAESQQHVCPVCGESLYNDEVLHRHHIIPTSQGGENKLKNIVLVHIQCHHSIHYGDNFDEWSNELSLFKNSLPTKLMKVNLTDTQSETIDFDTE
jgi:RNA-directed DNA polymerase